MRLPGEPRCRVWARPPAPGRLAANRRSTHEHTRVYTSTQTCMHAHVHAHAHAHTRRPSLAALPNILVHCETTQVQQEFGGLSWPSTKGAAFSLAGNPMRQRVGWPEHTLPLAEEAGSARALGQGRGDFQGPEPHPLGGGRDFGKGGAPHWEHQGDGIGKMLSPVLWASGRF